MNEITNQIFKWCMDLLYMASGKLGVSYEFINVIIFVILYPLITIMLVGYIIYLKKKIRKLEKI